MNLFQKTTRVSFVQRDPILPLCNFLLEAAASLTSFDMSQQYLLNKYDQILSCGPMSIVSNSIFPCWTNEAQWKASQLHMYV